MVNQPSTQEYSEQAHNTDSALSAQKQNPTDQSDSYTKYQYLKSFPSLTAFVEDMAPIIKSCADTLNKYGNLVTALATTVIAIFTWKLWSIGTQQGVTIQDQLRISERPYVEIANAPDHEIAEWVVDNKGVKTGINIYVSNLGNTPAQRLFINGGPDERRFIHLSMQPEPVELTNMGFALRPGETVVVDVAHGARRWIAGVSVPSHTPMPVAMHGISSDYIAKSLKNSGMLSVICEYEYVNIFGEYCCEPFTLQWSSGHFAQQPASGPRNIYCATNIQNTCAVEGEPTVPDSLISSHQ